LIDEIFILPIINSTMASHAGTFRFVQDFEEYKFECGFKYHIAVHHLDMNKWLKVNRSRTLGHWGMSVVKQLS